MADGAVSWPRPAPGSRKAWALGVHGSYPDRLKPKPDLQPIEIPTKGSHAGGAAARKHQILLKPGAGCPMNGSNVEEC